MLLHKLRKDLINCDFSQVTLQLLYYEIVVLVHEYQVGLSLAVIIVSTKLFLRCSYLLLFVYVLRQYFYYSTFFIKTMKYIFCKSVHI